MPQVRMPDGAVVAFPDDMPKEEIRGLIATKFPESAPTPPEPKKGMVDSIKGALQGFFAGAGQGATMGQSDEIAAKIQSGNYEENLAQNQNLLQTAREDHSIAYPVGEIAGTVAGAMTGVGLASKLAPRAMQAVGNAFGKNIATKTLAAADAGGVSGGAYGYGTAVGGPEERSEAAQTGAVVGSVAGPLGAVAAKPVYSLAERAAKLFKKAPVQDIPVGATGLSGRPVSQIPTVPELAQSGQIARLPKGAEMGDVDMMRAEENARQGLLGTDYQQLMGQVDRQVTGDILDATNAMTKGRPDSEEAFNGVVERLKQNYGRQKAVASNLMEKRNRALSVTKVYTDYTKGTLGEAVKELSNSPDFKVNLAISDNKPVKESLDYLNSVISKGDVEFADLSAWRKSLNNFKPGSQSGVMGKQLATLYDDWLENITTDALKTGDEQIVEKIFAANRNYRAFKEKFGTNAYKGQDSAIEHVLQKEELTPGQAVNLLFGKKSVEGRPGTSQNVGRILKSFTNEESRQAVRSDIRSGLILRAFENSLKADEVSLPIFRNNLMKLRNSETYKSHLADPEYDAVLDGMIKDITKFTKAQSRKDVYSPSAPALIRLTQGTLRGLGSLTGPAGRMVSENLLNLTKEGAKAGDRRLVEKSVAEFAKQLDSELNKSMKIYGPAAAGVIAVPPQITVRPSDDPDRKPKVDLPTL